MPELLDPATIEGRLSDLAGWTYADGTLRKTWQRKGFLTTVNLLNVFAYLANEHNHHPDLTVHGYNRLTAVLTTHDQGGVTSNDIELARALNDIAGA